MFQRMAILGPGLLGASLGRAARERSLADRIVAWSRRAETRARCAAQAWCDDVAATAEDAAEGSDFIVLCTPVETIVPLLRQIGPKTGSGALVTDVGSTKSRIVREARGALPEAATFLGSHPMAGAEQSGMEHARGDLFEGAACLLTPVDPAPEHDLGRLMRFWEALGMTVSACSPERHDEIVAHVSHLPHALASALCAYLATREPAWRDFGGGGLRDTTRIAAGDAGLWRDILRQNREEVLRAISGFEEALQHLRTALANDNPHALQTLLERGKAYRDRLPPERR